MIKITHIKTGNLETQPTKYGVSEKLIWNYHEILQRDKNFISDIKWLTEVSDETEILQIHEANSVIEARETLNLKNKIIYSIHDYHTLIFEEIFEYNVKAIDYADIVIFHSKQLMEYFIRHLSDEYKNKIFYFHHGVDTAHYKNKHANKVKKQFFIHATNGLKIDNTIDRKRFIRSIELAKSIDWSIIISGPLEINQDFFNYNKEKINYDKLTIVYDLDNKDIVHLLNESFATFNLSELEAGIPNLAMLESLSTGTPVIGSVDMFNDFQGYYKMENIYSPDEFKQIIDTISNDYEKNSVLIRNNIVNNYDWKKIVNIYKNILYGLN